MAKKQTTIVQWIVQCIVFLFALLFFVSPVIFKKFNVDVSPWVSYPFTVILIIVGAIGPNTIKDFVLKGPKGTGISISRHIPTEKEVEVALSIDKVDPEKEISDEPLVEAALQRNDDVKSATDFWLAATNAWKEKRYEEGLRLAYTGLSLNPADQRIKARLENIIGILFADMGSTDLAIDQYNKAMQTDPTYSMLHNNLGNLLQKQDKLTEAEAEYQKAIELDPENALAHYNLGLLLQNQGKLTEAEAQYRKAIELGPENANAHNNLGVLLKDQGKLEEAETEYRKAIELDPEFAIAHHNLGFLLHNQGKLEEAEVQYRKAIELDPKNADVHHNLGVVLKKQGKDAEGEKHLELSKSLKQKEK